MDSSLAVHNWLAHRDEKAARWLVESHRGLVISYVRRCVPHQALVDDVVQDVFVQIFATLGRFDRERPFIPWLMRITRSICGLRLRCWKRRRLFAACENPLDDFTEKVASIGAKDASPTEDVLSKERQSTMAALIDELSARDRAILVLQHAEGLDSTETAERLGTSPGYVRVRTCRVRQKLRRKLAKRS